MTKLPGMLTPADWEALYHLLGQIISDEPDIPSGGDRGSIEVLRWLGRAEALIEQVNGIVDLVNFKNRRSSMLTATSTDSEFHMRHIRGLLYTALAKAELNAPASAKGAFIPAGNSFDALTAISGVLRECRGSVLIVDPYMDAVALTDFLPMVAEGVPLDRVPLRGVGSRARPRRSPASRVDQAAMLGNVMTLLSLNPATLSSVM